MEWTVDRLRAALRLYLLADPAFVAAGALPEAVAAAIRGGVTGVRMRARGAPKLDQVELARALRALCSEAGVLLTVHEVDVALAVGADGVHLDARSKGGFPPAEARRLIGPDAVLGVHVYTAEEAQHAARHGADYLSPGPMYAVSDRGDGPAPGLGRLISVRAITSLPLVATGSLTTARSPELMVSGADGVLVGGSILRAPDIEAAVHAFRAALGLSVTTG